MSGHRGEWPGGGHRRGISIFEVLLAFVLLQAGMLVSVQALMVGKDHGVRARKTTYATLAAQARLAHVVREVVPTLRAEQFTAEPGVLRVPDSPTPLELPASIETFEVPGLTWQGTVAPTTTPGLYDVTVEVRYRGPAGRPQQVSLSTRAFRGDGGAP